MHTTSIIRRSKALCIWLLALLLSAACMLRRSDPKDPLVENLSSEDNINKILLQTQLKEQPPEDSFAVIGDEFSAGFLSSTSLDGQDRAVFDDYFSISSYFKDLSLTKNPLIPQGDDMQDVIIPPSAWNSYTASSFPSLSTLLNMSREKSQNLSVKGASLQRYQTSLKPLINKLNSQHKLVVVQAGIHDYCSGTDNNALFRQNLKSLLEDIQGKVTKLQQLILLPLPPIFRLANLSDRKILNPEKLTPLGQYIVEVAYGGEHKELRCHDLHKILCPPLTQQTREKNWKRWKQMNLSMSEAIQETSASHPGVKLIFPDDIFGGFSFNASEVSRDCFHPSESFNKSFARQLGEKISQSTPR